MPLGSTHDRITLWTLPAVTLGIGLLSRDAGITLAVSWAYLFSGLMFSGDLDIRSRQYQRWLGLRWIWLPYRKAMRHRSLWSHGPIVGTVGRVVYLGIWLGLLTLGILGVGYGLNLWDWTPQIWMGWLRKQLLLQAELWLWIGLGLELGSTNHSLSDWTISAWKRWRRSVEKPRALTKSMTKSNRSNSPNRSNRPKSRGTGQRSTHRAHPSTQPLRTAKTTRRPASRARSSR